MLEQHVEWTSPAPAWWQPVDPADPAARRAFRTPALLRFATDKFMDEFVDLMNVDPARLTEFIALPETWKSPLGEPSKVQPQSGLVLKLNQARNSIVRRLEARRGTLPALPASGASSKPLKLFQPAHQRYYLVTACLVCRMVGLPDRRMDTSKQERATFVVRLLQPRANAAKVNPDPADCDEFAFIDSAWQPVSNAALLPRGEEQHALSPLTYTEIDSRKRRLFMGLVPVGKREAYLAASQPKPATESGDLPPLISTRQMLLKSQVLGPWSNLEEVAKAAYEVLGTAPKTERDKILNRTNAQIYSISWYVLLDFANLLKSYAPPVWNAITGGSSGNLTTEQQTLLSTLTNTRHIATGITLASALKNAKDQEQALDSVTMPYRSGADGWPSSGLIIPLAEISVSGVTTLSPALDRATLETQVVAALEPEPTQPLPLRIASQAQANPMASPWFTIRCVFERPNCPALTQPLLSEPTAVFQISAYFDPDAPARPIRIGLPVDTTPAGLRKFDKNTAFIMSDTLCGQVRRAQGMTFGDLVLSVLPFPFHKDLGAGGGGGEPCSGGMVCSFSIPIITICALIMLIVIVKLLDIIFFWMPFFQICLPLPNFKAKGQA
jgi:hypothetical protein